MKGKQVSDLAARLHVAGATAPQSPEARQDVGAPPVSAPAAVMARKSRTTSAATQQITLRPSIDLWKWFVEQAAKRSQVEGRIVSAQEVALEELAKAKDRGGIA